MLVALALGFLGTLAFGRSRQESAAQEVRRMTTGLLAVIDMQHVFAEPGSPWAAPRFAEAAAGVRRLLPAFADRVTFTRFVAPEPARRRLAGVLRAVALRPAAAGRPDCGSSTDEFADRAPHVMDATTFGKWTPELAARVGPGGRLVLAGVSTDCCVLSTALAAADAGVEVLVVVRRLRRRRRRLPRQGAGRDGAVRAADPGRHRGSTDRNLRALGDIRSVPGSARPC